MSRTIIVEQKSSAQAAKKPSHEALKCLLERVGQLRRNRATTQR
jgi:hypothetical protein